MYKSLEMLNDMGTAVANDFKRIQNSSGDTWNTR